MRQIAREFCGKTRQTERQRRRCSYLLRADRVDGLTKYSPKLSVPLRNHKVVRQIAREFCGKTRQTERQRRRCSYLLRADRVDGLTKYSPKLSAILFEVGFICLNKLLRPISYRLKASCEESERLRLVNEAKTTDKMAMVIEPLYTVNYVLCL